jgi:phosphoglycolate phosphatase-like HAD superfamily hydrolase
MSDDGERLVSYVNKRRARHVVFDLDGTLVRLEVPWQIWIDEVISNVPTDVAEVLSAALLEPGAAWGIAVNECIKRGLLTRKFLLRTSRQFESSHSNFLTNDPLVRALIILSGNRPISVWTSNTKMTAERVLGALGIRNLIQGLVTQDDIVLGKPDPEGWSLISAIADARDTVVVGDSENDRLAAEAVGAQFFRVTFAT